MSYIKIGITALVGGLILSCAKTSDLPNETSIGENTLGYVLDEESFGTPFGGHNDAFIFGDSTIEITSDSRYKIGWNNEDYRILSFSFSHDGDGTFLFSGANYAVLNNVYNLKRVYELDSALTNFVEITFVDYDQKILSGNFELNFKPHYSIIYTHAEYADTTYSSTSNTYRANFTEGRFDLMVTD